MNTPTLTTDEAMFGGALLGTILTLAIIFYILVVIADWKIFTKAGEKGWKSLIPFYNLFIFFRLFWKTNVFWIWMGLTVLVAVLSAWFTSIDVGRIYMQGMNNSINVMDLVNAFIGLFITIVLYYRTAKSFGHGAPFTVGMILFPNIFTLILGFNKDKYKKLKD